MTEAIGLNTMKEMADSSTFIERLGKAARSRVAAGTAAVSIGLGTVVGGDTPKQQTQTENQPSATPAPLVVESPKQEESEYTKRLNTLKSIPGNEQVMIWPNIIGVDSPEGNPDQKTINKNRELIKGAAELQARYLTPTSDGRPMPTPSDMSIEFPQEPKPALRFFNSNLQSESTSVFLDTSGRFQNHQGLTEIINSIPTLNLNFGGANDPENNYVNYGFIAIPKENVPENGYVMVFSRPTADEKPNAKYDIWELDTAVFSDSVTIRSTELNLTKEYIYIFIGQQDRTDRLTPFYNKDNPAFVLKTVVIFDAMGKAVGKVSQNPVPFSPREPWMDTYQGNPSLTKP